MRRAAVLLLVIGAAGLAATFATTAVGARPGSRPATSAQKKPPRHKKASTHKKKKKPQSPPSFTVTADEAGWHHFEPGNSEACARFTVSPPQPNGQATISFGAKGMPPASEATAPDFAGIKTATYYSHFPISEYGVYTFTLTVTSNGVTKSASIDDDVQPSPELVPPCS